MIKIIYCITKKAGMDDAAFARYWRDVHGPIGARIPGLRKLVQSHVVREPRDRAAPDFATRDFAAPGFATPDFAAPDFDGVAELWFDDVEALLAARRSPEWRLSTTNEAHFVDPERVAYLVVEEHEVALPPTAESA